MGTDSSTRGGEPPAGLMQSLRNLAATALGVVQTRLELLVSEIEEERLRVVQLLVWGAAALLFLAFALLMFTFVIVAAFWETHRVAAAAVLGVAYLAIGVAFARGARQRAHRPRLFSATMGELTKDRDKLQSR